MGMYRFKEDVFTCFPVDTFLGSKFAPTLTNGTSKDGDWLDVLFF